MISARRFVSLAGMVGIAVLLLVSVGTAETKFASDDVAEAAKAPKAAEALAARLKMAEAFTAQDAEAVGALFADDLIVNSPGNRVVRKADVLGLLKAGRINYQEETEEIIEALDVREDQVVIMGEEVVKPEGATDNSGKTVRRRFTDVWQKEADGKWRLTVRQATITSVE